ncbi:hypothetical protein QV66_26810, partial [Klebsiella pneumoniae]
IVTPLVAKAAGLNSPAAAIVYGGLMGSTSGVAAGLAATEPKLLPYCAKFHVIPLRIAARGV